MHTTFTPASDAAPKGAGAAAGAGAATPAGAMSVKWQALGDAAAVVAMLAGMPAPTIGRHERDFPAAMRDAGGWRLGLAQQGVDDLAAVMEVGLAALLDAHASGADPAAAAQALLREFEHARGALLGLAGPAE